MFTVFHNGTLHAPNALDGEAGMFPFGTCSNPRSFSLAVVLNGGIGAKELGLLAIEAGSIGTIEPPWAVGSSMLWYTVSWLKSCGKLCVSIAPFKTDL